MLRSHRKTVKKSGSICNFAWNGGEFVILPGQFCFIIAIITPDVLRCSDGQEGDSASHHGHERSSPTQVEVFNFAQEQLLDSTPHGTTRKSCQSI